MLTKGDIWLGLHNQRFGPYNEQDIRQWLAEGKLIAETLAWRTGMSDWVKVATILPVSSNDVLTTTSTTSPPPPLAVKNVITNMHSLDSTTQDKYFIQKTMQVDSTAKYSARRNEVSPPFLQRGGAWLIGLAALSIVVIVWLARRPNQSTNNNVTAITESSTTDSYPTPTTFPARWNVQTPYHQDQDTMEITTPWLRCSEKNDNGCLKVTICGGHASIYAYWETTTRSYVYAYIVNQLYALTEPDRGGCPTGRLRLFNALYDSPKEANEEALRVAAPITSDTSKTIEVGDYTQEEAEDIIRNSINKGDNTKVVRYHETVKGLQYDSTLSYARGAFIMNRTVDIKGDHYVEELRDFWNKTYQVVILSRIEPSRMRQDANLTSASSTTSETTMTDREIQDCEMTANIVMRTAAPFAQLYGPDYAAKKAEAELEARVPSACMQRLRREWLNR